MAPGGVRPGYDRGVARAGLRPPPARGDLDDDKAYQLAFAEALNADREVRRHTTSGREILYRPRQLLTADADTWRVAAWLRNGGHAVTVADRFAGVTRLLFAGETDIPGVVTRLRDPRQWPGQPVPAVQPHHVLLGLGNIMGNPGGPPRTVAALPPPDSARLGEGAGVTVGICDTGIWRQAGDVHPEWLGGAYLPESDDEDPLYVHGDVLAPQGGHGTFVAGVVRQAAPGVRVDPESALGPTGVGDEAMLVAALGRLAPEVSVVNLSLGGFTLDDQPSLPLANAVAGLPSTTAVVAAAGNAGINRPVWPAALHRVLSVAAVAATTPARCRRPTAASDRGSTPAPSASTTARSSTAGCRCRVGRPGGSAGSPPGPVPRSRRRTSRVGSPH